MENVSKTGLHAALNELPVVLLLVAPLLLAFGLFLRKRRSVLVAAFVLILLGIASLTLAMATGEGARDSAMTTSDARFLLEEHRRLADDARNIFMVATAVFCVVFLVVRELDLSVPDISPAIFLAFVAYYSLGAFKLLQAAYHGWRLAGLNQ